MLRISRTLTLIAVLVGANAYSQCYVVKRGGQKIKGGALTASSDGTLMLQLGKGGPTQKFKKGTYEYGYIPKPKEVAALEAAYKAKKYDVLFKQAAPIFEKYKYLGWGDHVSYLEGMAHMARKQYSQARKVIERGERARGRHTDEIVKAKVLVLLGLDETQKVRPMLEKMMKAADDEAAAFAFNARGRLLAKEGKNKEAVLEHLKALLLFRPGGSAQEERQQASKLAVGLLKEMKDPRWQDVAKIK